MRVTIDGAGRLVIPKALRARLALADGGEVEVDERDGVIEIRPAPLDVRIVATPEGPVASPVVAVTPLTDDDVRSALDRVRR